MAKQISLFGDDDGQEADQSGTCPEIRRHRRATFDPTTLSVPEKRGSARVRFGTSSWNYEGWGGIVYRDVAAYGSRFERLSLGEYARDPRFRTVGADSLYYAAPADRIPMLTRYRDLIGAVPGFEVCPKIWHGITARRYTGQQQAQWRMPEENPIFLDGDAFVDAVLLPLQQTLGEHLGPLILEVQENDLAPDEFAVALDRFLSDAQARATLRMVVELRTLSHFTDRYVDVLRAHGVGHCLNSWTRMPPIGWQHERLTARGGTGGPVLVRALLRPGALGPGGGAVRPGNTYENAVKQYQPYDQIRQPLPDVRADILRVITETLGDVYIIVNSRLEGCAPLTIEALQAALWGPTAT